MALYKFLFVFVFVFVLCYKLCLFLLGFHTLCIAGTSDTRRLYYILFGVGLGIHVTIVLIIFITIVLMVCDYRILITVISLSLMSVRGLSPISGYCGLISGATPT